MLTLPRSAKISAALWIVALSWLLSGQADSHTEVHRALLSMAIASTVVAAVDRHAAQIAEVAALSYRAGAAASRRDTRQICEEMPAEPQGMA